MLVKSNSLAALMWLVSDFSNSEKVQADVANAIEQAQLVIENRSRIGSSVEALDEAINNLLNASSKEEILQYYWQLKLLFNRYL